MQASGVGQSHGVALLAFCSFHTQRNRLVTMGYVQVCSWYEQGGLPHASCLATPWVCDFVWYRGLHSQYIYSTNSALVADHVQNIVLG